MEPPRGKVVVITGVMAAGKSTVAELLARRLPKSVHLRGDIFRTMVVNGRAEMTPDPTAEAIAQLHLRYDLAALTADRYAEAGFDAVVQDVVVGAELTTFLGRITTPERYLVVLSPNVTALEWREQRRAKKSYVHFSPGALDEVLRRETAQIGYWLDSSAQSPEETVDDILANLARAAV